MTKTIPVLALAAALVLSTITMTNIAYAEYELAGNWVRIIANEADSTCTTPDGDSCGSGTAKARFQQLVTEVTEDGAIGVARGQIEIIPDIGEQVTLENPGPLSFEYDALDRILTMIGEIEGNNVTYEYDALGRLMLLQDNKARINFDTFTLTNQDNGNTISVDGLKGIVTETEPIQVQPGDSLSLRGYGIVLCDNSTPTECGTAKTDLDMGVESVSLFAYDGNGNITLELKFDDGQTKLELNNQEPLSYTYDAVGNRLTSDPESVYDAVGNRYAALIEWEYDGANNLKAPIQGSINLMAPNGDRFRIPIQGQIQFQELIPNVGDHLLIEEKGSVLVRDNDGVLGTGNAIITTELIVQGIEDGNLSGVGRVVAKIMPDEGVTSFGNILLENEDPLAFLYTPDGVVVVSGTLQDQHSTQQFAYDGLNRIQLPDWNENKEKSEGSFTMTGTDNGMVIEGLVQGTIVLM